MAPAPVEPNGDVKDKKFSLEQQYISLLEQRVAQLEKLVQPTAEKSKEAADSASDKADPTSPVAPLTAANVEKVPDDTKKGDKAATTAGGRVRHVISKYNEKKGIREETPIEQAETKDLDDTQTWLRNIMDASKPTELDDNEVDIGQGPLLDLLIEAMPDDQTVQNWSGPRISLYTPFATFVHNWERLKEAEIIRESDTRQRKEARADLTKVLEYVQTSKDMGSYFKNRTSYLQSGVVEFQHIWTLFPPGTEVVATTFLEEEQIMYVLMTPYIYDDDKTVSVWCWYYDYDGSSWVPAEVEFKIEKFQGTKPISSLACYPLTYYGESESEFNKSQQEALRARCTKRGKEFHEYCTTKLGSDQMFDYAGQILSVERPFRSQYSASAPDDDSSSVVRDRIKNNRNAQKKVKTEERILVDPGAFLEYAPASLLLGEREAGIIYTSSKKYDISPERRYLIAPPRLLGWSTRRKLWCQFMIRGIKKANMSNDKVFQDELQLDEATKVMIRALVKHHNDNDLSDGVKNPDLIEGKGRGLIILLHGPPGVGKTLTAEAIAEETAKPLLVVSVADIGLDASKAEANLERMFQLASRWHAVLLVDEADVFLESRVRESDPNRNALVSVLLRVLEYYQGIMILTTNRIRSLDVAVQSRIHLAVRYDDLTRKQMIAILNTVLSKFKPRESDQERILEFFGEFLDNTKLKLNGRQIRNLVISAQALARADYSDTINKKHMQQVMYMTRDFHFQLRLLVDKERGQREVSKEGD